MKVSIGTNIHDGPWGGGNLFAINLKNYLLEQGHEVTHNILDNDIDIVLLTEPRKTSPSSAYTNYDVDDYITYINPNALVVHRVNECDEHKNTNFINKYISYANKSADSTIFVSSWIKHLYIKNQDIKNKPHKVILAGADSTIFNPSNRNIWNGNSKIKFVTHHWSNNWNKGFDVYKKFDELLNINYFNENFEFNFIGRLPENFSFKNVNVIEPKQGLDLSNELKKNHFYITGTINEPSGNHHIEAAQCGLPVMFIDSGGVKEYCSGFGIEFTLENLEEKVNEARDDFFKHSKNILNYDKNSEKMCKEFLEYFKFLLKNKDDLISKRKNKKKSLIKNLYFNFKN